MSDPAISVLLPTRNRLEYLRYAVESVRRQDYSAWEIVVSDNCSEDDIAGYVRSLDDPRIHYYRTSELVPVTENWNNALERSTGDYVIMLGDDDCLMPGHLRTTAANIAAFERPEVIYTGALLYAYPGTVPEDPLGYLKPYGYAAFLQGLKDPTLLPASAARAYAAKSMDFRITFGFNMQFFVLARSFIDSLRAKGPFFQSPFPDYYAANVAFLKAQRILVDPRPFVTIGITAKSYGYYHQKGDEAAGMQFLQSVPDLSDWPELARVVLPGTNIHTSWLFAMEAIRRNYGAEMPLRVNYRRYRFLQIAHMYRAHYRTGTPGRKDMQRLTVSVEPWERALYVPALWGLHVLLHRVSPGLRGIVSKRASRLVGQFPEWSARPSQHRYANILDVFEHTEPLHDARP